MLVRLRDPVAGLPDEIDRLLDGRRAAVSEPRGEVAALQELHDDVRSTVQRGCVEHAHDVLAPEEHHRPGFSDESIDGARVPQGLGLQKLDGDFLIEDQMLRGHDPAHRTRTDDALDPIFSVDELAFLHSYRQLRYVSRHPVEPR